MSGRDLLFRGARQKLIEGTEVLRTGGGATLTSGECNAILDRLSDLERDNEHAYNAFRELTEGRG